MSIVDRTCARPLTGATSAPMALRSTSRCSPTPPTSNRSRFIRRTATTTYCSRERRCTSLEDCLEFYSGQVRKHVHMCQPQSAFAKGSFQRRRRRLQERRLARSVLVAMTGAAWGVRRGGSSQGGCVLMACHSKVVKCEDSRFCLVDWESFKLMRLARSSLRAESQAAAAGMGALEFERRFWAALIHDNVRVNVDESARYAG
eukprot:7661179-Pyramimonas_sp.AAC.2